MNLSGIADLPLHNGGVPRWLINRMIKLARAICEVIIEEYGRKELLRRLSDPFWFQAFGNVLGFDWHSSGITTVTTGVLKIALNAEKHGIGVCGGKGKNSLKTPHEIEKIGEIFSWTSSKINEMKKISKIVAKVDNAVLQDGFSLYHHVLIASEKGYWIIIQQGMDEDYEMARRYHWSYENTRSLIDEPHKSIVSDLIRNYVMNLTSFKSRHTRKIIVDLVNEGERKLKVLYKSVHELIKGNSLILNWIDYDMSRLLILKNNILKKRYLYMPRELDWNSIRKAYEINPRNFEEILEIRGLGPATLRGLALVANLIYGSEIDWKDPVKFSFAFGGKDGVPFPVNREAMDRAIDFLKESIKAAELGYRERLEALRRLNILVDKWRK